MKKSILIALSSLILASGSAFAAEHAGKTESGKPAVAKAVHQKPASNKQMTHSAQKPGAKSAKGPKKG